MTDKIIISRKEIEALIEAIGYISPYTVNDSVVNRWKALANVNNEKKG